jgi:hypothetical protein
MTHEWKQKPQNQNLRRELLAPVRTLGSSYRTTSLPDRITPRSPPHREEVEIGIPFLRSRARNPPGPQRCLHRMHENGLQQTQQARCKTLGEKY